MRIAVVFVNGGVGFAAWPANHEVSILKSQYDRVVPAGFLIMNITDTLMSAEEINLLADMVGKTFESYICDEFVFSPAVYQIVGLHVGGQGLRSLERDARERLLR